MPQERLDRLLERLIAENKPPFRYTPLGRGLMGLGVAGLLGLGVLGVGYVKDNVDVGGGMAAAWGTLVNYDNSLKQEKANADKTVETFANYALTVAGQAASDAWRTLIIYDGYLKQERVNRDEAVKSGVNYVLASSLQAAADAWSNVDGFVTGLTSHQTSINNGNTEYIGGGRLGEDLSYERLGPNKPGSWEQGYLPDEYIISNTNGLGACLRTEPNEASKTRRCWREGTQVLVPGEEENGYLPIIEPAEGWMPKQYLVLVESDTFGQNPAKPGTVIAVEARLGPATAAYQSGQTIYESGKSLRTNR